MNNCSIILSWLTFYQHKIPYAVILLVFSFISILLNLSLIVSFIATRQVTRNTSNILIFAISLSDLATAAVSMPLTADILFDMEADDLCIKSKVIVIFSSNGQFSIVLTILLAVDRYLHMNPHIQHRPSRLGKILKRPVIYCLSASIFICSNSISLSIAFELNAKLTAAIATTFTGLLAIQLIIIASLYTRGYLRIRKFTDNNPVYNESVDYTHNTTPGYVRRLYKTVMIIMSLVFIQYIPYCLISIIIVIYHNRRQFSSNVIFGYFFDIATLSMYAGSFTNCLAVLYFNDGANKWIFKQFGILRSVEQSRQSEVRERTT